MNTMSPSVDPFDGYRRRRHRRLPYWVGPAVLAAIIAVIGLIFVLSGPTISERQNQTRIINVVLPPPPPPPPPPPQVKPPPPPPTTIPPPQATPQTPPPTPAQPQAPQAQSNDALTARVGAGPSNFGLAAGNGSGTRIGGAPAGDNGFGAYADITAGAIRRAADSDPVLGHGAYTIAVAVQVTPDGRIAGIRVLNNSGDAKRNAALQHLVGLQIARRPPDGLSVMRLELDRGRGA